MADVRVFVLHPNDQHCQEITAAFHRYDPELDVVSIPDLRAAQSRIRDEKPAVVAVGVDSPNDPALKTIESISKMPEDIGIVVISSAPTQDLLVSCMRAGSDEFLEFPINADELAKAMEGLFRRKGIGSRLQGRVVAVFSASGGVGVTTLACNTAACLASEVSGPNPAAVIDMNLQFGAVALAMDVREFSYTLADVAREAERLDENLLATYLTAHSSGAAVLPAPISVTDLEAVDAWHLRSVIQTARKSFQFTVLDMPHAVDDCSIVGLDEADEVLLVSDMVLPTIRNTIRALEMFYELEYKREKIRLVINRFYDSEQITLDEIVEHVNLPLHWLVPYDSRAAGTSLNSGQMLLESAPESEMGRSLLALAQHTAGIAPKPGRKKKRGLFSWAR